LNDTMVDIFSSMNEDIEVITDDEVQNEQTEIIPIDQLLNQTNEKIEKKEKKKDKVLMIQIILLVTWAILTAVIYFFGYDFFEPFIKVK